MPVAEEPPAAGPADETMPVRPVADDQDARPGRRARDRSEHDPSIIPGLADDGHDDQIGRDR